MIRHAFKGRVLSAAIGGALGAAVVFGGLGFAGDARAEREVRGGARTSVNHNANANANVNRNVAVVNTGRYNDNYHPVATAAAVTTAAVVTGAVIGSMVRTLPPSCSATIVNGITYQNCDGTWYQPQYAGSQVTYVVVNAPG
ncbi:MAG: hypothetical protein EOP82_28850 [Variovorax sp.]|nr:MAG: hypothetical protein EOP82_28850 [Variovorax sp.]